MEDVRQCPIDSNCEAYVTLNCRWFIEQFETVSKDDGADHRSDNPVVDIDGWIDPKDEPIKVV
jgi:hypothetical protein